MKYLIIFSLYLYYRFFQTDIYEVCPNPLVLAQQLTHIELERLSMIGAEEFVQAFAKDNTKDVSGNEHFYSNQSIM